jgi:hypothetical protein
VIPAIVLAEIKHLVFIRRIRLNFSKLLEQLHQAENCIIYPVDEQVIEQMPEGLNIHDALIIAAGLVYQRLLKQPVKILSEDREIINSRILPLA